MKVEDIEITGLDLRYESYRMRSESSEKVLLCSIAEYGIQEPLEGVDTKDGRLLLNGFKRYRCAKKLGIDIVPYVSLGDDPAMGIIQLIRISNTKSLSILEQAKLCDELKRVYGMRALEIAKHVGRTNSWVSMPTGTIEEMSDCVREQIFAGKFPVYSYMYTLRQFIRMNCAKKDAIIVPEMEQFARQYGFIFVCHEVNHPNRKAGNERSFYTVETNFFPGRKFKDLEDLNTQALEWSTVIIPKHRNRPTQQEEKKLRALSGGVDSYLNFALKPKGIQRHKFIRELFSLSSKIALPIFIKTIY